MSPTLSPSLEPTPEPTPEPTEEPSLSPTAIDDYTNPDPDDCTRMFEDFVYETEASQVLDILGDGFGSGDVFLFDYDNILESEWTPDLVGYNSGRCITLEDETLENNYYCSLNLNYDDGAVAAQGVYFELVMLGGVNCFLGYEGVLETGVDGDFVTYFADVQDESSIPDNCDPNLFTDTWFETVGDIYVDWDLNEAASSGDVFVFDSNEINTESGAVGFLEGECMYLVDLADDKIFCTMTFGFEGSDRLTIAGLYGNMIIIGGLGCFFGASGSVSGFDNGGLAYQLTLDDEDSASDASCVEGIFDVIWIEQFGDVFIDYYEDGITNGDVYVFDNKVLTIPLASGEIEGTMAGRCFVTPTGDLYCQMAISLPGGEVFAQGLIGEMIFAGGNGCYNGINGYMVGGGTEEEFNYTFFNVEYL